MWKKTLVIGTLVAATAGSSLVYAQQRQERQDQRQDRQYSRQWQPSIEDRQAFGEARLAALRAGLALRPEQEKNWPAFEQAARDLAKLQLARTAARIEQRQARQAGQQPAAVDPGERLRRRGAAMLQTGAVLTRLGDATGPLYSSLDDAQKKRFAMLARSFGPRPGMQQRAQRVQWGDRGDRTGRGERTRGNPGQQGPDGSERGDRAR
jgi:hypothetical protein